MIARLAPLVNLRVAAVLALSVCGSVAILGLSAYRAVREWERTATLLAERHAQEGADLLALALTRDMRGAQESVLSSQDWLDSTPNGSGDVSNLVASTFARFPYPEVFFTWPGLGRRRFRPVLRARRSAAELDHRSARPSEAVPGRRRHARRKRRATSWSASKTDILQASSVSPSSTSDSVTTDYQAVVHLQYLDPFSEEPARRSDSSSIWTGCGATTFRRSPDRSHGSSAPTPSLVFSMYPERDDVVTATRPPRASPIGRRVVPMTFFDPLLIAVEPPRDLNVENWTLQTLPDRRCRRCDWRGSARGAPPS